MAEGCDGGAGYGNGGRPHGGGHYGRGHYGRGHHGRDGHDPRDRGQYGRGHHGKPHYYDDEEENDRGRYGRGHHGMPHRGPAYAPYEGRNNARPYGRAQFEGVGGARDAEPMMSVPAFEPRFTTTARVVSHGGAAAIPVAADERYMHAVAPMVSTLDVPMDATVGELQHYLGGKISPMFDHADTVVRARDAYAAHALDSSYMVHGARQFFKDVEHNRPLVYEFEFPKGTTEENYSRVGVHGGAVAHIDPAVQAIFEQEPSRMQAGSMKAVNINHDHHDGFFFDGENDSIEAVARAFGKAMFEKTKYKMYQVKEGKPLAFHLSLVDRKTGGMLEDLDHRYKQNGKASLIDVIDRVTGGADGSAASAVALKAVCHR